jgi:GxxExxY protein
MKGMGMVAGSEIDIGCDGTNEIIGAAIEVHKALGPGLLESVYEACLCHELEKRGIEHTRQQDLPVTYKGERLETDLRIDLLVQDRVIVELKAVERMIPLFDAQLLTYMRLAEKRVGLLLNFNVTKLTDGIKRMVL